MRFTGTYADNQAEIHDAIKAKWHYRCERCNHPHSPKTGHVLTIHHLDGNKSNNAEWNLACLCQRCHLSIQGKVDLSQYFMFEHSDWFKPHVEGYYASLQTDRS